MYLSIYLGKRVFWKLCAHKRHKKLIFQHLRAPKSLKCAPKSLEWFFFKKHKCGALKYPTLRGILKNLFLAILEQKPKGGSLLSMFNKVLTTLHQKKKNLLSFVFFTHFYIPSLTSELADIYRNKGYVTKVMEMFQCIILYVDI